MSERNPFDLTDEALTAIAHKAVLEVSITADVLQAFEDSQRRINRDAAIASRNYERGLNDFVRWAPEHVRILVAEQDHLSDEQLASRGLQDAKSESSHE